MQSTKLQAAAQCLEIVFLLFFFRFVIAGTH